VSVASGLVTDGLIGLEARGLLRGRAECAYIWGGEGLQDMIADGLLRVVPIERTHDLSRLSRINRFVSINTALQVGLDGSVNVERVGGRLIAGAGGHPDFCAAAARSCGGLSVIALASTNHTASTIVPHPVTVSTPRSDIDVVVTEHGIADLRGVDDAERARRLLAVASPEHRDELARAAADRG
jgi:acyl-CoA hydrolase